MQCPRCVAQYPMCVAQCPKCVAQCPRFIAQCVLLAILAEHDSDSLYMVLNNVLDHSDLDL